MANARELSAMLRDRPEVSDVRYPGLGAVVVFTLESVAATERFFGACELVLEATSFGGIHSSGERRARWRTDDIAEGFIRFSCGIEDTEDLLADVRRGLDVLSAA
jgi:cystathionine gamma-lyase